MVSATAEGQWWVFSYNGTREHLSIWSNPGDVHTDVCVYYGAELNTAGEVKTGSGVQGTSSIWYDGHILEVELQRKSLTA